MGKSCTHLYSLLKSIKQPAGLKHLAFSTWTLAESHVSSTCHFQRSRPKPWCGHLTEYHDHTESSTHLSHKWNVLYLGPFSNVWDGLGKSESWFKLWTQGTKCGASILIWDPHPYTCPFLCWPTALHMAPEGKTHNSEDLLPWFLCDTRLPWLNFVSFY